MAPAPFWRLHLGYTLLSERFRLNPGSRDTTQGVNEHDDPRNQFWLRSFVDLPGRTELDAMLRSISALPNPAVPGYAELTLRLGWGHPGPIEIAIVGDNLLHDSHQEFVIGAPAESIHRSGLVQVTWRYAD